MNIKKVLIFDSSTIITLSMNNLLGVLSELSKSFVGVFVAPYSVRFETVKRPSKVKRFKWNALLVDKLFNDSIIKTPEFLGVSNNEILSVKKVILDTSNNLLLNNGKPIHIIDDGEAECLALSKILSDRGVESVIAVDERTSRIIVENPSNLGKIIESKIHDRVTINKSVDISIFSGFKIIRSSELVFVAFKKGLILPKTRDTLDAVLYATKFKGNAITVDEIKKIESLV